MKFDSVLVYIALISFIIKLWFSFFSDKPFEILCIVLSVIQCFYIYIQLSFLCYEISIFPLYTHLKIFSSKNNDQLIAKVFLVSHVWPNILTRLKTHAFNKLSTVPSKLLWGQLKFSFIEINLEPNHAHHMRLNLL